LAGRVAPIMKNRFGNFDWPANGDPLHQRRCKPCALQSRRCADAGQHRDAHGFGICERSRSCSSARLASGPIPPPFLAGAKAVYEEDICVHSRAATGRRCLHDATTCRDSRVCKTTAASLTGARCSSGIPLPPRDTQPASSGARNSPPASVRVRPRGIVIRNQVGV
jgi:hypothetical protein